MMAADVLFAALALKALAARDRPIQHHAIAWTEAGCRGTHRSYSARSFMAQH
jgi:hypothetical protein